MDSRRVGIVGGGQLGRMMCEAGHRIGVKTVILDPLGKASPAGEVAQVSIQGSGMLVTADLVKVKELAAACDVVTIEIEHVDTACLAELEEEGIVVSPSAANIAIIQDKFLQKEYLAQHGIPLPDFMTVPNTEALDAVAAAFGYPYMLKSRCGAYDGNGNFVVRSAAGAAEGFAKLKGGVPSAGGLYAERWVPFAAELAVMVVCSTTECVQYPVVETTQKDNICHTVVAPARVPMSVASVCADVAKRAVQSFKGIGIFGVELFLLDNGNILLNEIAPRPHNSGHYTMEACAVDQFENHLRAVLGLPLGESKMVVNAAVMLNILGESTMEETIAPLVRAMESGAAGIHWYGKTAARKGRKMAHVTFVGPSLSGVMAEAEAVGIAVLGKAPPLVSIIMGSESDLGCMRAAADILKEFGVPFEISIVSAHRTPERMFTYGREAASRGLKVIIAGAGGAAHLPGMVAALTSLPVVGVPVKSSAMSGLDSLYSIVQMPRGIPVATVAIGNAMNAGLLAVRMLSIADPMLGLKLDAWNKAQTATVLGKAERMEADYEKYAAELTAGP